MVFLCAVRLEIAMDPDDSDPDAERPNDADTFASFMSDEMQIEMKRLTDEQKILRKEIQQLRQERDFLFELLNKKEEHPPLSFASETLTIENEPPSLSFASETLTIEEEHPPLSFACETLTIEEEHPVTESCARDHNATSFSKARMIDEMQKYQNSTFRQAREVIKHAQNGDSIMKYLINFCGTKMDSMEQEIQQLRDETARMASWRRTSLVQSIRSLNAERSEQLSTLSGEDVSEIGRFYLTKSHRAQSRDGVSAL